MKEYLDSLTRLEALPPDTLVLPSHGLPFRGLHDRLAQLREHHLARLDDVASVITGKTNAFAMRRKCSRGCCTPIRARRSASRLPI